MVWNFCAKKANTAPYGWIIDPSKNIRKKSIFFLVFEFCQYERKLIEDCGVCSVWPFLWYLICWIFDIIAYFTIYVLSLWYLDVFKALITFPQTQSHTEHVVEAAAFVKKAFGDAEVAIILGSGLNDFADSLDQKKVLRVPVSERVFRFFFDNLDIGNVFWHDPSHAQAFCCRWVDFPELVSDHLLLIYFLTCIGHFGKFCVGFVQGKKVGGGGGITVIQSFLSLFPLSNFFFFFTFNCFLW